MRARVKQADGRPVCRALTDSGEAEEAALVEPQTLTTRKASPREAAALPWKGDDEPRDEGAQATFAHSLR